MFNNVIQATDNFFMRAIFQPAYDIIICSCECSKQAIVDKLVAILVFSFAVLIYTMPYEVIIFVGFALFIAFVMSGEFINEPETRDWVFSPTNRVTTTVLSFILVAFVILMPWSDHLDKAHISLFVLLCTNVIAVYFIACDDTKITIQLIEECARLAASISYVFPKHELLQYANGSLQLPQLIERFAPERWSTQEATLVAYLKYRDELKFTLSSWNFQ
jgi:hypothetical protein